MKRDMDLIRALMFKLEDLPMQYGEHVHIQPTDPRIHVEGYATDGIAYHLTLIEQAGFIEQTRGPAIGIMFSGISWESHDFIDSVRSPDVWEKTKKAAAAVGGFTVEILVASAKTYLQQRVTGLLCGQS